MIKHGKYVNGGQHQYEILMADKKNILYPLPDSVFD